MFASLMLFVLTGGAAAMGRTVGVVTDADTGEKLSYVTVCAGKGKKRICVTTDSMGVFVMNELPSLTLQVRSEGYQPQNVKVKNSSDTLRIGLVPKVTELAEFVVRPKKQKYSKKNNPAVDLMQRVRADMERISPDTVDGYNYDLYEKMVAGIYGFDEGKTMLYIPVKDRKRLMSLIDTAIWTGDRVMNLAIKERSGVHVYDKARGKTLDLLTAQRNDGLDKEFSREYTNVFLDDVVSEIDIFGNDIKLLRNTFVSPLSRIGADFYKYEIVDTVRIGDQECVELAFVPHKAEMTGFNGKLYIPVGDSVKYVRRAMMRLPKSANVNYIRQLVISQNFTLDSLGKLHKTLDDLVMNVQIIPKTPVLYFSRQTRHAGFNYRGRPEYKEYMDKIGNHFMLAEDDVTDEEYWRGVRLIPLTRAEANLFADNSVFKTDKGFWWFKKILAIVVKGYIQTGGKNSAFDIGPIDSFISYSRAGGWRVQLGGMTTANLSSHFFMRGYAAYGFGDHRWKGGATLEYSFERKKYYPGEFPMNNIRASWSYDLDQTGAGLSWGEGGSSILNSWRRVDNDYVTYRHKLTVDYIKEWRNNLSINVGLDYVRQEESRYVKFEDGFGGRFPHFTRAAFTGTLRWAPGEKTVQQPTSRLHVNRDALVISLTQEYGFKGLLGSKFNYSKTALAVDKVFWFSAFGYADVRLRAAKIWTQVAFTDLLWQDANTSYMMKSSSFSLLNPMELAMDQFAGWSIEYHANGLLFNRIPLIKKLKLREVIGFKGFVGSLTKKNNPEYSSGVFRFPDPATRPMGSTPYMECSVGLENILTFLRVDCVWRLTYRNAPNISKWGVRVGFNFTF